MPSIIFVMLSFILGGLIFIMHPGYQIKIKWGGGWGGVWRGQSRENENELIENVSFCLFWTAYSYIHAWVNNLLLHPPGEEVAIKVLESIHEMIEEIEEEYQVLRDLSEHPNMPRFYGMFLKPNNSYDDQIWLVMEVRCVCVCACACTHACVCVCVCVCVVLLPDLSQKRGLICVFFCEVHVWSRRHNIQRNSQIQIHKRNQMLIV